MSHDPLIQETVYKLTKSGVTAKEIAEQLSITRRTVERHRDFLGLSKRNPPPLSEAEIAQAKRLFAEGCSRREVARTLGRSPTTLMKWLPDLKWTIEQSNEYRAITRQLYKGVKL